MRRLLKIITLTAVACLGGVSGAGAAPQILALVETPEPMPLVCAGGVESMSRLGMGASGGAMGDPWVAMKTHFISQGLGADLLATLDGFSRDDVDRYALQSQQRAAQARDQGFFKSIVPVTDMNGVTILDRDEMIRDNTSLEGLAGLKPAFQMFKDFGQGDLLKFKYPQVEDVSCIHTPGNSSAIVDGAVTGTEPTIIERF